MVADARGTLRPPEDPKDFLKVAPELEEIATYDFEPLLNKDSTNMVPADWTTIANAVYERRNMGYAGFVVAHGTDTMHFTASALAFALGPKLDFPVVFTGAQTTPAIQHGDARINLLRAARVAKEDLAEVVISFGDYVFRGCRTQKKDEKRFDAFESPALYPIADITEKILMHPTARKRGHSGAGEIELKADFADGLLQVGLIPGLKPDLLEPVLRANVCSGIVLQSFGAGNVPDEKEYAFGDFIRSAIKQKIPVVITSQFPANSTLETHYAPGVAAIEAGAIATGNMTSAAATVKFRWVIARVRNEIAAGTTKASKYLDRISDLMTETYVLEMD
jgi:L-asparaginase type I